MQATHFSVENIEFDRELLSRLPALGPRYTSYPTADRFHIGFHAEQLCDELRLRAPQKPVSLYVHIPFCSTICYYCGCNKIITKNKTRASQYLDYLDKELSLIAQNWQEKPVLAQLHLGGGTPTFLSDDQFERLMTSIKKHFVWLRQGEYSIEIDPRKVSAATVHLLGKLGFNRMSVGVQDFDEAVQKAVNRVQTEEETRLVIEAARAANFRSINIDLIYGLPFQTTKSMEKTLKQVMKLSPDRLALYHYAHLPHLFKPQRRIDIEAVPNSSEKLDILQQSITFLLKKGYFFIGMDHFAKPTDELAVALNKGYLQRNFQGYSTYADCDLIAIGVSAIGKTSRTYSQNEKELEAYYNALNEERLPILRGVVLNDDDVLRRQIIHDLMCRFGLNFADYEETLSVPFAEYFKAEWPDLLAYENEGLLTFDDKSLHISKKGRLLIRHVAMVFDAYLRRTKNAAQYSQTL